MPIHPLTEPSHSPYITSPLTLPILTPTHIDLLTPNTHTPTHLQNVTSPLQHSPALPYPSLSHPTVNAHTPTFSARQTTAVTPRLPEGGNPYKDLVTTLFKAHLIPTVIPAQPFRDLAGLFQPRQKPGEESSVEVNGMRRLNTFALSREAW